MIAHSDFFVLHLLAFNSLVLPFNTFILSFKQFSLENITGEHHWRTSLENIRVGIGQVDYHLSEERVGPCEPLSGYLRWVVHRKGLVHQVVLGRFNQTIQAVFDLVV